MIFRQLFEKESSTYTYLLADPESREAIIIDPVVETHERDSQLLDELGLRLKYILDTHVHADHITGASLLHERFDAWIVTGKNMQVKSSQMALGEGDSLEFGPYVLKAIETPGHTNGCTCYLVRDKLFTGDTLLIRGCGRTDFQEGSAAQLFKSVRQKLFSLPEETIVYPAHDYKGFTFSTIGEEKLHNPRLKMSNSQADFEKIMAGLNLSYPKKMDEAVPANLRSGEASSD